MKTKTNHSNRKENQSALTETLTNTKNFDLNKTRLGKIASELSMLAVLKQEKLITEGEFAMIRQQIMKDYSFSEIHIERNQNER